MIYIQSNTERTLPHHFDAACALYGAIDCGLDYRLTSFEEVESGKFDLLIPKNLFVGSTEFMAEVFSRMGLSDVRLPENSNREYGIITLDEAFKRREIGERLFIKPLKIKQFTGFVLDKFQYSSLANIPLDTKIMVYEPFKEVIKSEWRIYINSRKIIDSKNYAGDWEVSPSYSYVKEVMEKNMKTFPMTYTIDIGILENNANVVIEFNDMWAIGNYGVPNDLYLIALKNRYFEIVRNK